MSTMRSISKQFIVLQYTEWSTYPRTYIASRYTCVECIRIEYATTCLWIIFIQRIHSVGKVALVAFLYSRCFLIFTGEHLRPNRITRWQCTIEEYLCKHARNFTHKNSDSVKIWASNFINMEKSQILKMRHEQQLNVRNQPNTKLLYDSKLFN